MRSEVQVGTTLLVYRAAEFVPGTPPHPNRQELLLLERRGSHGDGSWSSPGGHVHHWERFQDAIVREVYEETGMRVPPEDLGFFGMTDDRFPGSRKHYCTLWYLWNWDGQDFAIEEPDKCSAMGWVPIQKIESYCLFLPWTNLLRQCGGVDLLAQRVHQHAESLMTADLPHARAGTICPRCEGSGEQVRQVYYTDGSPSRELIPYPCPECVTTSPVADTAPVQLSMVSDEA